MTSERAEGASLRATRISKHFGGLRAVSQVDLEVAAGSITGLIGPNGAGKTTMFNVLTKFEEPSAGSIELDGEEVTRLRPWDLSRRGMVRSFQTPTGFPSLTVWENLLAAAMRGAGETLSTALIGRKRWAALEEVAARQALATLSSLNLLKCRDEYITELTPGNIKLVDFARQLMCGPRILMLDEPASGVDPERIDHLARMLTEVRDRGVSLLIIDHNIDFLFDIAEHVYVMDEGEIVAQGPPIEIANSEEVIRLYLGTPA